MLAPDVEILKWFESLVPEGNERQTDRSASLRWTSGLCSSCSPCAPCGGTPGTHRTGPAGDSGSGAFTVLGSSAWLAPSSRVRWYDREARKRGLLLKENIVKLHPKICISHACFTSSFRDPSSLLPKGNDFSTFFTVLPCQAKSLLS